ncbi:hypothetical protein MACH01_05260 [Thalassospira tepidiphila]|nr:hypothetical protein MACH01_05260 [Thalassospira tepidiphila]
MQRRAKSPNKGDIAVLTAPAPAAIGTQQNAFGKPEGWRHLMNEYSLSVSVYWMTHRQADH